MEVLRQLSQVPNEHSSLGYGFDAIALLPNEAISAGLGTEAERGFQKDRDLLIVLEF